MSLTAGTRLGPYEVVAPLGAGGMGEVYRARDTRLGRDVAIKILPAVVAADPERKARFEREARTLASLRGEQLLVTVGRGGNADIGAIGFNADRQFREVLTSPSSVEASPALSPDGRWLAYHSNLSGTFEVYVERFPELGQRQRISTSGGSAARWSPSSRELFFQSADGRRIFTVPVTLGAKLGVGTAKMRFEGPYVPSGPGVRGFEVMPDGRFLLLKGAPVPESNSPATVTVVQNWFEELKRLVPGAKRPQ